MKNPPSSPCLARPRLRRLWTVAGLVTVLAVSPGILLSCGSDSEGDEPGRDSGGDAAQDTTEDVVADLTETGADVAADTIDTEEPDPCALPEDPGTWTSFAEQFFSDYCVECHNDDGSGVDRDFHVLDDVVTDADHIRCGVAPEACAQAGCEGEQSAGTFPVGDGPFPNDTDRLRIVSWINQNLPE